MYSPSKLECAREDGGLGWQSDRVDWKQKQGIKAVIVMVELEASGCNGQEGDRVMLAAFNKMCQLMSI